jgi:hypothetical protein
MEAGPADQVWNIEEMCALLPGLRRVLAYQGNDCDLQAHSVLESDSLGCTDEATAERCSSCAACHT